jgi:hypothetical protein
VKILKIHEPTIPRKAAPGRGRSPGPVAFCLVRYEGSDGWSALRREPKVMNQPEPVPGTPITKVLAMSSTPDPARMAEYQARLAELVAARDSYHLQGKDHKVRLLNRQIQAQLRWIRRARSMSA